FEFRGVGEGAYRLVARAEDGARATANVRCFQTPPIVRLDLVPATAVLEGRAVHEDGRPFQGLALLGDGRIERTRTDAEGRFRFEALTPGQVTLILLDPGRLRVRLRVEVPRDEELLVVVDEGARVVAGRVVAADDEGPVVGAEVVLTSGDLRASGRTDEGGAFSIMVPGDRLRARVTAEGFGSLSATVSPEPGLVLRLLRRGSVEGRVVREDGTPVPGVPVVGDPLESWIPNVRATSGEDGAFALPGVGPGAVDVYALGSGWVSEGVVKRRSSRVNPTRIEVPAGGTVEVVLTVVPAAKLIGRVVDARGTPLAGVSITVETGRFWFGLRSTATEVTDRVGAFAFDDLVPGYSYTILVVPHEGLPVVRGFRGLAPGETLESEIVVPDPRWVALTVLEAGTGKPVVAAGVTLRQNRGSVHLMTDERGTATLGPLQPGPATVRVDHGGYLCPREPRPVPEYADRMRIELEPALFIAGRVEETGGSPCARISVSIEDAGALARTWATRTRATTGEDGTFRLGPLPPGEYQLALWVPMGGRLGRHRARAGEEDLVLRVEPPADLWRNTGEQQADHGEITVRWRGPDGRPAVGGHSDIKTEDSRRPVRTGRRMPGMAHYRILEPGVTVWVEVWGAKDPTGEPLGAARIGPVKLVPGTIDVDLPAERRIEGRVLGPDGKGLEGIQVTAAAQTSRTGHATARTDREGRFALRGLGDMRYLVRVHAPWEYAAPDPVVVEAGATDLAFRLVKAAELTVHVFGPDGEPFYAARIVAVRLPDRAKNFWSFSHDDGEAIFDDLDPGHAYDLRITDARGGLAWSASDIRPGPEPVVARLAPGLTITGKLALPPEAYRLEVFAALEGSYAWGRVEEDGRFVLAGLTEGTWNVNASAASKDKVWHGTAKIPAGSREAAIKLSPR
ncbi:MAG: carboxypeptidase regulatory-like domain-containing protein, partial [Planctomycetota bacterium]